MAYLGKIVSNKCVYTFLLHFSGDFEFQVLKIFFNDVKIWFFPSRQFSHYYSFLDLRFHLLEKFHKIGQKHDINLLVSLHLQHKIDLVQIDCRC